MTPIPRFRRYRGKGKRAEFKRADADAPFRILSDGREICKNTPEGWAEYRRRRTIVWKMFKGVCQICFNPVSLKECTADHVIPRGMGSAYRDDRIENLRPAHGMCNQERGSKRVTVEIAEIATTAAADPAIINFANLLEQQREKDTNAGT